MKKVAILIPGLLRTFEKTSEYYLKNIIEPNINDYEIDIYLGFWNHSHKRGDGGNRNEVKKINNDKIDTILRIYNPKKYIILDDYDDKNKIYFPEVTRNIIDTIGTPKHPDGTSLIQNGLIAQTYTWFKTYSLLEGEYDYVVKSRFDIATEKISFSEFEESQFNCAGPKHQHEQYDLADAFFASNQIVMERLMNKYHLDIVNNRIPNISEIYPNVFPEYILKDYLLRNDIKINYLNKTGYGYFTHSLYLDKKISRQRTTPLEKPF